jgi:hypothetical protein
VPFKIHYRNNLKNYDHLSHFLNLGMTVFTVMVISFTPVNVADIVCPLYVLWCPTHVPFKIHYRNNLIDKKDSYLIPRPPSWDDRNYSYGHQLYSSELSYVYFVI